MEFDRDNYRLVLWYMVIVGNRFDTVEDKANSVGLCTVRMAQQCATWVERELWAPL